MLFIAKVKLKPCPFRNILAVLHCSAGIDFLHILRYNHTILPRSLLKSAPGGLIIVSAFTLFHLRKRVTRLSPAAIVIINKLRGSRGGPPRSLLGGVLLLIVWLLSGCYLLEQGSYIITYQNRATDIDTVLREAELPEDIRALLENTKDIKRFAVHTLGLKQDKNYTTYVEIDQDFLVYVVSACKQTAFEPYIWKYPFFGGFPYKGFYEKADAVAEAEKLKKKGYDVIIRKVDAYSTLGFFIDPIYSFMKKYSLYALASLIIHEQTHATIFLKDQVQFNEELATFVGNEGALAYIRDREGPSSAMYRDTLLRIDDSNDFYNALKVLHSQLEELYQKRLGEEAILKEKKRIVEEFVTELTDHYDMYFSTDRYRRAINIPANNAYILSYIRYTEDLSLFYALYKENGKNLPATIELIKQVEEHEKKPKAYLRSLLK